MKTRARRALVGLLAAFGLSCWSGSGGAQAPGVGDKNGLGRQESDDGGSTSQSEEEENVTPGTQRGMGASPSRTREAGESHGIDAYDGERQGVPVTGETAASVETFLDERSTTVSFARGGHDVSQPARQTLQSKLNELRVNGRSVEKAVVVVWSDQVDGGGAMSMDQSTLAYRRGELLRRALDDMGVAKVQVVSSENLASDLPKALESADPDLAAVRESAGGQGLESAIEGRGGPSEALVIFLMEPQG